MKILLSWCQVHWSKISFKFLHELPKIISGFIPLFISDWFYLIWLKTPWCEILVCFQKSLKMRWRLIWPTLQPWMNYWHDLSFTIELSFITWRPFFTSIKFHMTSFGYTLLNHQSIPVTINLGRKFWTLFLSILIVLFVIFFALLFFWFK
jgi:hypothetical protein